ncbi:MAG: phage major tail tube protein [Burkholderiales bacterium]|nr:phage major tail tube protein [Burkholderiales bacterium]
MATILEMDAANLFCDDLDPTQSQFLTLEEVKIPSLMEKTREHTGGGAIMTMRMGMGIFEPIELTFKLRGYNPEVMNKIMNPTRSRRKFTITGNVRDLEAGRQFPVKIVIEGRMTKVDMGSFQRDGGISTDYQIDEVCHYELYLDGAEKYYLDVWTGPLGARVDGSAVYQDMARNLGLA